MRTMLLLMALVGLLASPPALANYNGDGPERITTLQWEHGTFLTWSPAEKPWVLYNIYRGTTADDLVLIARTHNTAYYDMGARAGDAVVYAVTILSEGEESRPTFHKIDSTAACASVGLNGSVVLRPQNCLPLP